MITMEHEYFTNEGEVFDLEIEYSYVHDSDTEGGCEEVNFKVTGYRQYEYDDTLVVDLPKLTPEQSKDFTDRFNKMVEGNQKVMNYFYDLCDRDYERKRGEYDE